MNRLKPLATKKYNNFLILLILSLCLLQSGCSSSDNNSKEAPTKPSNTSQSKAAPTLDLTPYVSESKPFSVEGVKFYKDIPYKTVDAKPKQKFDFYMPESKNTTGLVIFYHGGAFIGGDKWKIYKKSSKSSKSSKSRFHSPFRELLDAGIAVASVNYRFIQKATDTQPAVSVKTPIEDMRYFLQFARYYANSLNINAEKIILSGESAGASAALLIGLHDNEEDRNANDPILKQSTRVKGLALWDVPASMNIQEIPNIFAGKDYEIDTTTILTSQKGYMPEFRIMLLNVFGAPKKIYNAKTDYAKKMEIVTWISTSESVKELNKYLSIEPNKGAMTADDPELWIKNEQIRNKKPETTYMLYHHSVHAKKLHEWANKVKLKHQSCWRTDTVLKPTVKDITKECYGSGDKKLSETDIKSMAEFVKNKFKEQ